MTLINEAVDADPLMLAEVFKRIVGVELITPDFEFLPVTGGV